MKNKKIKNIVFDIHLIPFEANKNHKISDFFISIQRNNKNKNKNIKELSDINNNYICNFNPKEFHKIEDYFLQTNY